MPSSFASLLGLAGMLDGAGELWLAFSLGTLTLLFEDVALGIGASVLAGNSRIAVPVYVGLFVGIVAGDIALYALGRWMGGLSIVRRAQKSRVYAGARDTFNCAPTLTLLVARIIPASRLPVFVLAGVDHYPFARFAATIVTSVALWTAGILFGGSALFAWIDVRFGISPVELLVLAVGCYLTWLVLQRLRTAPLRLAPMRSLPVSAEVDESGMPRLDMRSPFISFFEFWPTMRFYWPLALYMVALAVRYRGATLITAANPGFPMGGLVGESKVQILGQLRRQLPELVPTFVACRRDADDIDHCLDRALNDLADAGLAFPLVAKPDLGCRGAGVRKLETKEDLRRYFEVFPASQAFIVQQLVDEPGEAGIFYVRDPDERSGRVISITLKYFPEVTGDGSSTLGQLIERDPRARLLLRIYLPRFSDRLHTVPKAGERVRLAFAGNHSKGTIFRNGNALITPQLEAMFDRIAREIPGFHFGRFDIRFADFRDIQAGIPNFRIIELNGAGAEATHVWDSRTSLLQAWKDLAYQYRLGWAIGAKNRARGARPAAISEIARAWKSEAESSRFYPSTL